MQICRYFDGQRTHYPDWWAQKNGVCLYAKCKMQILESVKESTSLQSFEEGSGIYLLLCWLDHVLWNLLCSYLLTVTYGLKNVITMPQYAK